MDRLIAVGESVAVNSSTGCDKRGLRPYGRGPLCLYLPLVALTAFATSGCGEGSESLAGRYAVRGPNGAAAVFTLDSLNRYWMDGDSANVDSYFQSGDTVFLTFKNKGMPFLRRGDTLRYEGQDGQSMQLVRIRNR